MAAETEMMKISLERLLVESSKLQNHREQSCVIRNVAVENVGSSVHRVYMVCLFTSQLLLALTAPTHGGMTRLS